MIEAQSNEIAEEQMIDAIKAAHIEIKKLISFIEKNLTPFQKRKIDYQKHKLPEDFLKKIEESCFEEIKKALLTKNKIERDKTLNIISENLKQQFKNEPEEWINCVDECLTFIEKKIVRDLIFHNQLYRTNGRLSRCGSLFRARTPPAPVAARHKPHPHHNRPGPDSSELRQPQKQNNGWRHPYPAQSGIAKQSAGRLPPRNQPQGPWLPERFSGNHRKM